jgi:hypothetical protein
VSRLTEEQNQLLEKLVDGYWSGRGARGKEDFHFGASMGLGTTLTHRYDRGTWRLGGNHPLTACIGQ